ncbi:MAG: isoleucine--tRNA ligase [Candidatus Hydrogenedentes bacterium]|nr:isoleucine--tRNA ligase [Candidatus Hydrogenedentota bacterium]
MSKTSQKDYSQTVNLPKTEFPMKANLPKREPGLLRSWEETDLYGAIRNAMRGKQKRILHDGPPYANGNIHIGTAFNKLLKDFVVKYLTMRGYDSPYVPGWDCHGLPIEYKVLSELGEQARHVSQVEVRAGCKEYALKYVDIQRDQFKRLGILGDWGRPYLTLSHEYEAKIVEVFGELYLQEYVYRGKKPVHWCPSCRTALAEAEVEYSEHTSPSVYVKFPVAGKIGNLKGQAYFLIWTTTPWTLPANLAICLHPDFTYVGMKVGDETFIVAEPLVLSVVAQCGIEKYEVVDSFSGNELEGQRYRHVLAEKECPIILGDHVTLEQGTGCVHTAPGHGQEDYVVGQRYSLETYSPVDDDGRFTDEAGEFAGLNVFDANDAICKKLSESGALLYSDSVPHSYPHCWRCMKPIIFRATEQWFIRLDANDLRDRVLRCIKDVRWVPPWGAERIGLMVSGRPDWCISRQRAWGVPIPVFYCKSCGQPHLTRGTVKKLVELVEQSGIDLWFEREPSDILGEQATCECGGTEFDKERDILDVWFESGVSHRAVLESHEELAFPVDIYLEGSDQHRGWFQSSLIPSVALRDTAPYRTVITHGFVVDGEGMKMSKKLGNVVDPLEVVEKYGADLLRLWVASENYTQDVKISPEILGQVSDAYRKIRNTWRFMLGNLYDFDPETDSVPYADLEEIDRWALHRLQELKRKVIEAYDRFEFHQVYHAVYSFCTGDLSSFYLDVLKDRLYTFAAGSRQRRSAQTVLVEVLKDLIRIFAPLLSFTAEEAWQCLPRGARDRQSVHLAEMPEVRDGFVDAGLAERWAELLHARGFVLKALEDARRSGLIGNSLEAKVSVSADGDTFRLLDSFGTSLPSVFIVSEVELSESEGTDEPKVSVEKAAGLKCVRCWNYRMSVGRNPDYPDICDRCVAQMGRGLE